MALTLTDRERVGREASPAGAILDAQAARSGGVGVEGVRGYDPAKRVVGRKRHTLTDTDGRLLTAAVAPADLHDSHGGVALLRASRQLWPPLAHCFADRAYRGGRVGTATSITVEIVEPEDGQTGFAVQPRRWVIERTPGWISRCRRLARDHEATTSSALAFFVLATAMILVRRQGRSRRRPDKLHVDKAYDARVRRQECRARGIRSRIARRGIERSDRLGRHRWVVERSHAWFNRARRLPLRYERSADIYEAFTFLQASLITIHQIDRFC